ncbi:peptidase S8 [filamentous cyanobacterium LEGE 11480]|uniref:Peptidase S8 n=1 Tax=Romeriopsis navalis LEGE 11480 TaxID=2777977 RepID=A0A928Z3J3_9CYAN|nr:S8 family peptidase [Romeriopsis navalis]MBE9029360.1 peptidase S8 [Romeriopsis navalis LEGE 11480]
MVYPPGDVYSPDDFLSVTRANMKRWLLSIGICLALGWTLVTLTGLTTQGSYNAIIIDFREDIGRGKVVAALENITQISNVRPRLNSEFSEEDQVYVVEGDRSLLGKLRRSSWAKLTEIIEPNYFYSLPEASQTQFPVNPGKEVSQKSTSSLPNDPLYPQQWNLHKVKLESARAISTGKNVTVAIIDTGIAKVPDLDDLKFVRGYDFINDETNASDDQGHGTHIAGTIAQMTNNGYGAAGIAPDAKLMPLKVVTVGGSATAADIAEAVRLAADRAADVINLSLSGSGYSKLMQQSIDYAYRKGAVIVAAAGNSNQSAVTYPARYHHVLSVSATDITGKRASYSNFGAGVNFAAPGGVVTSEKPTGGIIQNTFDLKSKEAFFAPYQGSSFAAAHVSGAAALIKSIKPLDPAQIEQVLAQTSQKPNSDPLNEYGVGQINITAALNLVQTNQIPRLGFWQQLNHTGQLGQHIWIDADMIASKERLLTLTGAIVLALLISLKFALQWNGWLLLGLILSSSGFFVLQGTYVYGAPQWIFRLLGSALPEVGTVVQGLAALDPLSASVLLPTALWLLLGKFKSLKWFAIGSSIGIVPSLISQMLSAPEILQIGTGLGSQIFLLANILACIGLNGFILKTYQRPKRRTPNASNATRTARTPQANSSASTTNHRPVAPTNSASEGTVDGGDL